MDVSSVAGQPMDAVFWLKLVAVIGVISSMMFGAWHVFSRLKAKEQGFGPNSLQALAIVFFLPTMVIVSLLAGLESEAMAALLGTVAGYILSSPKAISVNVHTIWLVLTPAFSVAPSVT
ncbi:hypothetical protein [Thioflavicoccus mobilis]|uniref:hypothetical protein n=1 Tax=Thioflavicoccus mobilis TaxID=80679 RepID=UPI001C0F8C26|nr:hypothetical protein [Thioflavicoccus mobilis]